MSGFWVSGLMLPGLVALASNCVSINIGLSTGARQGAMASLLYLVMYPAMAPPWVPLLHHPGYTPPAPTRAGYVTGPSYATKRVLWALIRHCVTLKRSLKSV